MGELKQLLSEVQKDMHNMLGQISKLEEQDEENFTQLTWISERLNQHDQALEELKTASTEQGKAPQANVAHMEKLV